MFEEMDPRSATPLYAQIAAEVKLAIASGELPAGHGLPSVRQLATTLRVNPATVVQAYRALEGEGFVETRHGAGTFVSEIAPERRKREREANARRLVRDMLAEAARLGLSANDLSSILRDELKKRSVA
jgi:GntR family transcriptional regulator